MIDIDTAVLGSSAQAYGVVENRIAGEQIGASVSLRSEPQSPISQMCILVDNYIE